MTKTAPPSRRENRERDRDRDRPSNLAVAVPFAAALFVLGFSGCGGGGAESVSGGPDPAALAEAARNENPELFDRLGAEIGEIINEAAKTHRALDYDYDEDLVRLLDRIDKIVNLPEDDPARARAIEPRLLPDLTLEEERDHFARVVARWTESAGGVSLRDALAPLLETLDKSDLDDAARAAFRAEVSKSFDSFVRIEAETLRERRNRAIRQAAEALLQPIEAEAPRVAEHFRGMLDAQYPAPDPESESES